MLNSTPKWSTHEPKSYFTYSYFPDSTTSSSFKKNSPNILTNCWQNHNQKNSIRYSTKWKLLIITNQIITFFIIFIIIWLLNLNCLFFYTCFSERLGSKSRIMIHSKQLGVDYKLFNKLKKTQYYSSIIPVLFPGQ